MRIFQVKCQCHEIFDPRLFSSNNPPRALIHGLKPFRTWLRICRVIRDNSLQIRIPRCQWDLVCKFDFNESAGIQNENFCYRFCMLKWDHGSAFSGVTETTGSDSAVSMRPRKSIQRCHWNHRFGFRGLNKTTEILWHHGNLGDHSYWLHFP
jgi:hypothetical protein